MRFRCLECARDWPIREVRYRCDCGGLLEVEADWTWDPARAPSRGLWRYQSLLPVLDEAPPVTLAEGGTPLVRCDRLAAWAGVREVHVKVEGANPTGSFKDRGMTVGVTLARGLGMTTLACASTGNTSASLAAYGARAGMRTLVLLPRGKIAAGKMAQAFAFGARVVEIDGGFDDAMTLVEQLSLSSSSPSGNETRRDEGTKGRSGIYLLNSLNPLRLEGQKTLLFEVLEAMEPDRVIFPVGNGGNISAAHKALRDAHAVGLSRSVPILSGVQAEGASPLARAWRDGTPYQPQANAETLATAIRIGAPVNASKALRAVRDTGGFLASVADDIILEAQRRMATEEGLFVEPASAAPLAGLKQAVDAGLVSPSERVVLVATGNGLKDADAALRLAAPPIRAQPTLQSLLDVMRT